MLYFVGVFKLLVGNVYRFIDDALITSNPKQRSEIPKLL